MYLDCELILLRLTGTVASNRVIPLSSSETSTRRSCEVSYRVPPVPCEKQETLARASVTRADSYRCTAGARVTFAVGAIHLPTVLNTWLF